MTDSERQEDGRTGRSELSPAEQQEALERLLASQGRAPWSVPQNPAH